MMGGTQAQRARWRWLVLWGMFAMPVAAQQAAEPAADSQPNKPKMEIAPVEADPELLTSLFFSSMESEAIEQARRQYASRGAPGESEQDLLDQLQGIMSARKPEEELQEKYYAQFYLKTLMYHTPNDWTAWLKAADVSRKFTPDMLAANDIGVKVIGVDKEDITLEWKPKDWISVSNAVKREDPAIVLDQANRTVIFTLRVNQTLSSVDMNITEGMINLTPVDAGEANKKEVEKPLPVAPGAVSNTDEPASGGDQNPASAGVLEMYQQLESAQQP